MMRKLHRLQSKLLHLALRGGRRQTQAHPLPKTGDAITRADDAFHYKDFAQHSHSFWYVEWWYFNFFDEDSQRAGMVTFAVFNPGDKGGLGVASLNAAVFPGDGSRPITKMDYLRGREFWASYDQADVTLGPSTVRVLEDGRYAIHAITKDQDVQMDLIFTQADEPRMLAQNVIGDRPWEISSWLVYMPSARVQGTVTVKGQTWQLERARGYHDHDWGIWLIPERIWSWAQFSNPDRQLSFDVGLHAAFQKSTAYMRAGELRLSFPQSTFKTQLLDWHTWRELWKYPTRIKFTATDTTGQYQVDLVWIVQDTSALWKYPLIVFEQTARFTGALRRRSKSGWEHVLDIRETGYSEYTSRWIGGGDTG